MVASALDTERKIVKCRHDHLVYLDPRPNRQTVIDFHEGLIGDENVDKYVSFRREILAREAAVVKAYRPLGGKLLDVGCAAGTFFESFQDPLWQLYGVDPSPVAVERARARGAEVFLGTLRQADYPNAGFDVVSLLDAIYYLPDPMSELTEIYRILKPDGICAVEIPGFNYSRLRNSAPVALMLDRGSPAKKLLRSNHLYFFNAITLRALLRKAGFRILKMVPEQASLARHGWLRRLNDLHFAMTRILFKATAGRLSIAGKELYLAVKA